MIVVENSNIFLPFINSFVNNCE